MLTLSKFSTRMIVIAATAIVPMCGALLGNGVVASAVLECGQTESWTFNPALTTSSSGTYQLNGSQTCAHVDVNTLSENVYSGGAAFGPYSYSGSCLVGSLTPGGILVGGTVAIFTNVLGGGHFHVLAAPDPCNDAGPTPAASDTTFIP